MNVGLSNSYFAKQFLKRPHKREVQTEGGRKEGRKGEEEKERERA